ncbi:MAG TPA: NAD(P)/FAD-dependent oxidoreductase [Nocardioidaceae bacterium]|nr:NAD(P)/FAD-dependent oxidoreductase [Nocardioidaceae bacterium]
MTTTDTVVIGAGHAGLAVSTLLRSAGRDHVVLDRGRVAERWRTERWDSLHLLTPRWMTRLPGWLYTGPDQEGFMSTAELVRYLERYARAFDVPVETGTPVLDVSQVGDDYRVATDRGTWRARNVVVATGPWGTPRVPEPVRALHDDVSVVASNAYRNPASLPAGGVLVVGASSSGLQIADELARAGRDVVLAVGRHTRMPRRYRGMDVFWWLERTGRLSRTIDDMPDPVAARSEPSMQLLGRNERERFGADLDLGALRRLGVRTVGHLADAKGSNVWFRDDLHATTGAAEKRMHRFLDAVDRHIAQTGLEEEVWPATRPEPLPLPAPVRQLDLRAEGIRTVVLATGYRPHHPWLRVPVTAPDGSIRQHRGATDAQGLYVVGQRFQHRRDSGFIDGARHDARAVVGHITGTAAVEPEPALER